MDSYRAEKEAVRALSYLEETPEIEPTPLSGGGGKPEAELHPLSVIVEEFNTRYGDLEWCDRDRVQRLLTEDIPRRLREHTAYDNALRHGDEQNARIEHAEALRQVFADLIEDDAILFREFHGNREFQNWLEGWMFRLTSSTGY